MFIAILHLPVLIANLLLAAELPTAHRHVQQTIRDLEEFRRDHSTAATNRLLSNTQLHELLQRKHGTPTTFEVHVLCWPMCPAMKGGGPKLKEPRL